MDTHNLRALPNRRIRLYLGTSAEYGLMIQLRKYFNAMDSVDLTKIECGKHAIAVLRFTLRPEQLTSANDLVLKIVSSIFKYQNEITANAVTTDPVICGNRIDSATLSVIETILCQSCDTPEAIRRVLQQMSQPIPQHCQVAKAPDVA